MTEHLDRLKARHREKKKQARQVARDARKALLRARKKECMVLIREHLEYDPKSGLFFWKKDQYCNKKKGDPAGHITARGCVVVRLFDVNFQGNILAWALETGAFPTSRVRHINGDKLDNRWANLRIGHSPEALEKRRRDRIKRRKGYRANSALGDAIEDSKRRNWERNNGPISQEQWEKRFCPLKKKVIRFL